MRVGLYEMQVLDQSGVPLKERIIGANNFVEAATGQEYKVKVFVHRKEGTGFPMKYAIVRLLVDGAGVNYHMRLNFDDAVGIMKSAEFTGFRCGFNSYNAFVFTLPDAAIGDVSNESKTGHLKVEISEAVISSDLLTTPASYVFSAVESPRAVTENKKPTERATLGTVSGRTISFGSPSPTPDQPLYVWKKVRTVPDAILEVKCHTADNLDFIQMVHDTRTANQIPTDLTTIAEQEEPINVERSVPSTAKSADPAAQSFDLTKVEPPPEVEYIGGCHTTGAPAETSAPGQKAHRKRKLKTKIASKAAMNDTAMTEDPFTAQPAQRKAGTLQKRKVTHKRAHKVSLMSAVSDADAGAVNDKKGK